MAENIRIGVIGVGRIGTSHAKALAGFPGVEVVLADRDSGRAAEVAAQLGVGSVTDVADLATAGLGGIVVATATATHPDMIRFGVDAGLPVFSEKPISLDLAAAVAVEADVRAKNGVVQMGFQRRFDEGFVRVRDAIQSGELGRIHTIRSVNWDPFPPDAAFIPTSGGIFRDCATHDADVLRWATGEEVIEVFAIGSNGAHGYIEEAGDFDSAVSTLRLTGGLHATFSHGRYNEAGYDARFEAAGVKKTISAGFGQNTAVVAAEESSTLTGPHPASDFYGRFVPAFAAELEAFVDLINGGPNRASIADAVEAAFIVEALDRSAHQGRPVQLAEIKAELGL
ncbi:Gfo/Idh/MocA family oxidoreductase [Saxibacter everestensis]|uniref:Gfo/Idh/MocA family oxidoreductase n=1 Tax=Saxibacter everestensis TaxID=2909229 RepID=A0ABY8QPW6_9MICO|nr:Gfo/Idh/MocA family oxidoreductase [Brevibacteriaceae bacterium ZFBP1038]